VIVTVTLNPVLHVRYDADRVELGSVNRVSRVRHAAAGRGLVVARLLHEFGHDVVAAGLAGGSAGELIRGELSKAGVATQFTRITAESRRQVQITDSQARMATSFAEPAPYITTEELGRFAADYRGLLDGATAVVLCGSLPDGLPPEIYGSLTSYASSAGVPVILDAGGSALQHGAARGPALVIPELAAAPSALEQLGRASVVLPISDGVRVLTPEGEWLGRTPQAGAGFGVGDHEVTANQAGTLAGFRDALVAGFVPGIALAWSWPDTLRHAVALAASVSPDGAADLAAYEALLPDVAVTGPVAGG
jgi:tagatose 6-phosphate kinase